MQLHGQNIWLARLLEPPCALSRCRAVGYGEEQAVKEFSGNIDVYVSRFKPMKHTISGRDERTLMCACGRGPWPC
jgi:glutathione reductase (NADPH)